jgi:adenylosuccinate synthase
MEFTASRHGIRVCDLVGDFKGFEAKFRRLVEEQMRAHQSLEVDIEAELWRYREYADAVRPMVKDTTDFIHRAIANPDIRNIVVEGTNAMMLDIDFGTYPFVTSSNSTMGGVSTGLGIPPRLLGPCYGVCKAYTTRVGAGPFPTELTDATGDILQDRGRELGNETKRRFRYGWLDIPVLRHSHRVNGYAALGECHGQADHVKK